VSADLRASAVCDTECPQTYLCQWVGLLASWNALTLIQLMYIFVYALTLIQPVCICVYICSVWCALCTPCSTQVTSFPNVVRGLISRKKSTDVGVSMLVSDGHADVRKICYVQK
jgi:hypothetical protein